MWQAVLFARWQGRMWVQHQGGQEREACSSRIEPIYLKVSGWAIPL